MCTAGEGRTQPEEDGSEANDEARGVLQQRGTGEGVRGVMRGEGTTGELPLPWSLQLMHSRRCGE